MSYYVAAARKPDAEELKQAEGIVGQLVDMALGLQGRISIADEGESCIVQVVAAEQILSHYVFA